jgi:hypothetical protein
MLADGTIHEKYWAWARAIDPDVRREHKLRTDDL